MNRGVLSRQMFAKGGAAFPDLNKDGEITQADILMGRGVEFKQEGGIAGMMQPPAAEQLDPQVVDQMLTAASQTTGDLEGAQDYEQMMNMVRGDDATMGERREELAGVVGPEDAMQTPESVLALVQPVMQIAAVDQGIGELAQQEMQQPMEGPMAGGIMSTMAPPPPPAAPPTAPPMMGGPPPANFKDGGLVRRGDNQPVQKFQFGGTDYATLLSGTVGDLQNRKLLRKNTLNAIDEARAQQAALATAARGTEVAPPKPSYKDRLREKAAATRDLYSEFGLGSAEGRAAALKEQKDLTQAQMLFDIANTALTFAAPMQGERAGLSPAERLAMAATQTQLPQTIGARAQKQLESKRASEKEERALGLAAVQRAESIIDKEDAAASALAVKRAEMEGKVLTLKPGEIAYNSKGEEVARGAGETHKLKPGEVIKNDKNEIIATGDDKTYMLSVGQVMVNAAGEVLAEGKGQAVSVAPGVKIVDSVTGALIAEGTLQPVKGIPRDVWDTLSSKAKNAILDNPSINGVPASIFNQLNRSDQNIIMGLTENAVNGIPKPIFDALSEDDQRKVLLGAESREERIKDIPVSVFEKLPQAVKDSILGAYEKLSPGESIVNIANGETVAEAPPKREYKMVNDQLVVVDPATDEVKPLFGTATLPPANYLQLTVDGVTTVVDANTTAGRNALETANQKQRTNPGSVSFTTISSAQKPPKPKGFLVRDENGDRVGVFTSYDGRNYVDDNGDIVQLDSNDIPVSDTITYQVLQGEAVRSDANDQLIAMDNKIIEGLTGSDGKPLSGGAREEVRNALREARLGTGFWSSVYAGIDNILGGVVAPEYFASTFRNTQDARQFTRMVATLGRSALAASPRFAVADLALTQKLFPDPDAFLTNPVTEARKLIPLSQELESEKRRILTAIRDVPDMPSAQKTTLNQKLYEINRLQELLGPVTALRTMGGESGAVSDAVKRAAELQSKAVKPQ